MTRQAAATAATAATALIALIACLAVVIAACTVGGGPASPAPSGPPPPPAASPSPVSAASTVAAGRPDHVVVVMLENKDASDVLPDAPYLASLAAVGTTFTDMHAETHPSQPNYIALFSGDTQGVYNDSCPHAFAVDNLAAQLTTAGFSFTGYSEDLPEPGYTGCRAGKYARKHSPWTNFSTVPAAQNQPLTAMPSDYAVLPTVAFLIPNLCHDMHDCSITEGDRWLRATIDGYAHWARTHNSLLLVTFDESEDQHDRDNHILTIAVGQKTVPGAIGERADHYRLLRTLENLYGLPPLGHAAATTPIPDLWNAV